MAAAQQPDVPTRLYKPLPSFQLAWMKKKLEQARGKEGDCQLNLEHRTDR
jgi:hypothetical protein